MEEDEIPVKKPRKPDKRSTQERTAFQGFRKPESAYFSLPNEWTDITAEITSLSELKIIEYIARHTWGFREFDTKKEITTDEFMYGRWKNDDTRFDKGTQLSDRGVKDGVELAEKHGYIEVEIDASDKARIRKFYGLKMISAQSDRKSLPITISSVDRKKLPPDGKTLPIKRAGVTEETSHRSKKENKRHLEKEDDTSIDITPEIEIFRENWIACKYRNPKGSLAITAKNIGWYHKIAPHGQAVEDLERYCLFAISLLPAVNDGLVHIANLHNCHVAWSTKKDEQSQQASEGQEDDYWYPGMDIPANISRNVERACKKKWGMSVNRQALNETFKDIGIPPKSFILLLEEELERASDPDDVLVRMKQRVTSRIV